MNKLGSFGLAIILAISGISTLFSSTSVKAESSDYIYTKEQLDALNHLNEIRSKIGVHPVKLNPFLTKAAENHAKYLNINPENNWSLLAHNEESNKKGYTGDDPSMRIKAVGGYSTGVLGEGIAFRSSLIEGIDNLIYGPYHRDSLISADLEEVGFAFVNGVIVGNYYLGDGDSVAHNDVVYPYNGQTNVDIGFYGDELPNPLNQFGVSKTGYAITYQTGKLLSLDTVYNVKITNSKGEDVPVFVQNGFAEVYIFPKDELAYNEKYTVTVTYNGYDTADGWGNWKPTSGSKTWSFTTKPDPRFAKPDYLPDPTPIILPSGYYDSSGKYVPRKPFTKDNVGIGINGDLITVNPPAFIRDGNTFIPLRGVFDAIEAKVTWFKETHSIEIEKWYTTIRLTIGDRTAYVNGKPITLSVAPFISSEGSTYVPLRFISETIGAKVGWDAQNFVALIITK